ncbi:sensor histidine kinase [Paenibacillus sp. HB172176]|uniref:cache domain-containing sensor histidine kinase n=1 Tax=Paenibacillus sp. HB172176 TaxID=2493690 RepID=UPI0014386F76|nr:sensor histidine kinase [Paenibacillus sp. HB172176]
MKQLQGLYGNLRIKYKVIALITLMMLVIGMATLFVMRYTFQAYDREIYKQSAGALNNSSLGIEKELRNLERLSFNLSTDSLIQGYLGVIKLGGSEYDNFVMATELRKRLLEIGGFEKYVWSFQLLDAYGNDYRNGNKVTHFTESRIDQIMNETAVNNGGVTYIFPANEDAALIVGREIRQVKNLELDHLGAIAIRLNMDELFHDFVSRQTNGSDSFAILDEGGNQIYTTQELPDRLLGMNLHTAGGGYKVEEIAGEKKFITYAASQYMDWTYVNMSSYDAIFRKTESAKRLVLLIYFLLFLAILLAALLFSRSITKPIESLSNRMKRVQLGHFDYVAAPGEREPAMDEAGLLHRNFRIMVERIEELINENYVKQLAIKDTEFKALQAQINPHFLYNTLESINWSAKLAGHKQISVMVESLGYLLRSSINGKDPLVRLEDELASIRHYISIQQIRFEERLQFSADIPEALLRCMVPKLSLQPLVENAIQYALEQMLEPCQIVVSAREETDLLLLSVTDNGPGMARDILQQLKSGKLKPRGTGVGLSNINERIKLLFGVSYGLDIDSGPGTQVTLRIPVEMRDGDV